MKSIFYCFVFIIGISSLSTAQDNILLSETFDNNANGWQEFTTAYATADVQTGSYLISYTGQGTMSFWRSLLMRTSADFYIEAQFRHLEGAQDFGFGLVWGASGWDNSYNFVISSNGFTKIYNYKEKNYAEEKAWTPVAEIRPTGKPNVLAIVKRGSKMYYYVNGKKIHEGAFGNFYGSNLGFVVSNTMKVAVDYILVKHPSMNINPIDSAVSPYNKSNMGAAINSATSEIAPIISPDGKTLFVARKGHAGNIDPQYYDIWQATRQADGTWSALQNLGAPLNNKGDNLVISVTADGNMLLLEGLYNADGSYKSDQGISMSQRTASGWSIPKEVVIKNYYNLDIYESFTHSTDRSVLVMSVKRHDTNGNKDLYVSFLQADGTYSEPVNMGTDLNTYENEGTPFLAPDNATLYFYSYGHPGYGSADIFVTRRLDNTWKRWSTPQNLGSKINSNDWDTYYTVPASGDFAYLVSTDGTLGEEDIYSIPLQQAAKPQPVVLVRGTIYDSKTKRPLSANIVYEDLQTGQQVGTATSDPATGRYTIILPYGKNYGFMGASKGYFSVSEHLDLLTVDKYTEIDKDLFLTPFEVGEVVTLNNVFFDRGLATLRSESYPELDRVVAFMQTNNTTKIEISGHTEMSHSDKKLSQDRADAVRNYIVSKNIDSSRITAVGYANTRPVTYSSDPAEQARNRRVEFKIVQK